MKKWTIYCHINKINNKRYIGQTDQQNLNKRWQNGNGYKPKQRNNNTKFWNAIQKYGWNNFQHIILEDNIPSLEQANKRQQYWITYYHTFNNDKCGYNMTPGGDNHILNDEAKEKLRQKLICTYKNHPEKIIYQREKQAQISGKPVYCFEKNKTYISISQAARDNNVDISAITRCLLRKNQITTNGLHWKYADDNITLNEIQSTRKKSKKKVLCEETGIIYNSPKQAATILNLDNNAIAKCCRGTKKTYFNLHWRYISE